MPNGPKKTAHAGRENIRYGVAFLILLILLVIFLAMNVCIGTVNIPGAEIPKIISGHGAEQRIDQTGEKRDDNTVLQWEDKLCLLKNILIVYKIQMHITQSETQRC